MKKGNRAPESLPVEELSFSEWSMPGDDGGQRGWAPPRPGDDRPDPVERSVAWLRRRARVVGAVAGGLAVLVAVVVVATSPSSAPGSAPGSTATTAAPPTTRPRPIAVAPQTTTFDTAPPEAGASADRGADADYRALLPEIPDGFEITGAETLPVPSPQVEGTATYQLFTGPGATLSAGPWLLVASAPAETFIEFSYRFTRPPTAIDVNGMTALIGRTTVGDETTIVRSGDVTFAIASRALPPATTSAIARQVVIDGVTTSLSAGVVPAGLAPRTATDIDFWRSGWSRSTRAYASYQRTSTPYASVNIAVAPFDPTQFTDDDARFFLDDLRYAVIDGQPAIAGTYLEEPGFPVHLVLRRAGDRQIAISAHGGTLDAAIAAAADVVTAADPAWRNQEWVDAQAAAARCCTSEPDSAAPVRVDDLDLGDMGRWSLDAAPRGDELWWSIASDRNSIGASAPLAAPVLSIATSYYFAWQEPGGFYVGAFALVDRSMTGAVLRLRTTGTTPQVREIPVHTVEGTDFAAYLLGGTLLPWADGGFIVELVAPDGQVIATQTDLDLP